MVEEVSGLRQQGCRPQTSKWKGTKSNVPYRFTIGIAKAAIRYSRPQTQLEKTR